MPLGLGVSLDGVFMCLVLPFQAIYFMVVYNVKQASLTLRISAGVDAVEEDETGAAVTFPERSTDPRGADICEHTANFRRSRYDRSIPSQPQGLVLSTALIQEFLVWVVAFSALLGVLVVLVTRKRKKAQQRAFADSMFTGREGGGNFDSEIIREYKERYYAREKGLEAAMKRSDEDRERDD